MRGESGCLRPECLKRKFSRNTQALQSALTAWCSDAILASGRTQDSRRTGIRHLGWDSSLLDRFVRTPSPFSVVVSSYRASAHDAVAFASWQFQQASTRDDSGRLCPILHCCIWHRQHSQKSLYSKIHLLFHKRQQDVHDSANA